MKFHTYIDPVRQRVNVYCEVGEQDGKRVFLMRHDPHLDPGAPTQMLVAMGEEPPLWDWFPLQVVDALAEALSPRPPATERHLDDAIAVRDRLLAMVESFAHPPHLIGVPG